MTSKGTSIKWSDIDKNKFYGIGTGLYTAITLALHPISVIKTRRQVLNSVASHTPLTLEKKSSLLNFIGVDKMRALYRGVGVILLLAIPARGIYIYTLETSREAISEKMTKVFLNSSSESEDQEAINRKLIVSLSGGLAGGIAAASAQLLVVPMDIISQKQIVMDSLKYKRSGSIFGIVERIIQANGWRGLYRGFALSLFSSLPTGTVWWATYSGCQQSMQSSILLCKLENIYKKGIIQMTSGMAAGILAATLTQPLDVIKTRLQVGTDIGKQMRTLAKPTYSTVTIQLIEKHGYKGLFRGTTPRIVHIALWGTILSSAYEYLRHVSMKDNHFQDYSKKE